MAEGQRAMLEGFDITEEAMGISVQASMETIQIGSTDGGIPVHVNKIALPAATLCWPANQTAYRFYRAV